jgi:antitoxin component of RelBE/YafQ-DinJ toxin-antitoxin module
MHEKKKKDSLLIIRLTGQQKEQATRIATEHGATVSELIRVLIDNSKKILKLI